MKLRNLVFSAITLLAITKAVAGTWIYHNQADAMSGKSTHQAQLVSDNTLALAFPYGGQNNGMLIIRKHPKWGTDVIFQLQKGQLMCRSYRPCNISVKFDNKAPKVFKGAPAEDNDSTLAFLTPTKTFIAEASKASRILVEITLFKQGTHVLEFTSPVLLTWKPPK
jgi:hypothetical protein